MSWKDDVHTLPNLSPAEFEMAADSVALMIIDMQYLDAHRDYGLGVRLRDQYPDACEYYFGRVETEVVPNCAQLLQTFRRHGLRVIHVTYGPELQDGADLVSFRRDPLLPPGLYPPGSFEREILPELKPQPNELVINKTGRGAFNSTGIERALRNLRIESIVLTGVTTSSCVETTGRDAADRGFRVAIVEDATAELDAASHDATMRQFAMRFGRVWTTDEALEQVEAAVGAGAAVPTHA
jgi:nicotinamidase-related amidase